MTILDSTNLAMIVRQTLAAGEDVSVIFVPSDDDPEIGEGVVGVGRLSASSLRHYTSPNLTSSEYVRFANALSFIVEELGSERVGEFIAIINVGSDEDKIIRYSRKSLPEKQPAVESESRVVAFGAGKPVGSGVSQHLIHLDSWGLTASGARNIFGYGGRVQPGSHEMRADGKPVTLPGDSRKDIMVSAKGNRYPIPKRRF